MINNFSTINSEFSLLTVRAIAYYSQPIFKLIDPIMTSSLMNNYARLPISFSKGEGVYLYDDDGNQYLDALSGIAVCNLGHAHPELADTIAKQARHLWHTSNIFEIPQQSQAADTLTRISGMDKVMFCNSGTEANEAAIKLTRIHARNKGIDYPQVISFYGGFHGRTFGAMAATANPKIRAHFEPHLSDFIHLELNNLAAIEAHRYNPNVVAIMLECLQGEGGIHPIKEPGYLKSLRDICDQQGWLLICDEVQVGFGRSGRWFGFQHYDIQPDIVTMAKGLGNGIPVGACLARGAAADYFQPGMHGTTFGGTPLVMSVVNKTLEIFERDHIVENAAEIGAYLQSQLRLKLNDLPLVQEIRGLGLMIGIELERPIDGLVTKALDYGIIINVTSGKVIRLLPPLIFTQENADELVTALNQLLRSC